MTSIRKAEARLIKVAGVVITALWSLLVRTRREEMVARISNRLGVPIKEAKTLAHQVYCTLGFGLAETLWIMMFPSSLKRRPICVEGWSHLSQLKNDGQPFVVVTVHQGNWEFLTHLNYLCGIDGVFASKRFRWGFAQRLMSWSRKGAISHVPVLGSARQLVSVLKRGRCVGFAIDQHTNDASASEIKWLGHTARVLTSPARLARLARVPIVPIRTIWRDGMHVVQVCPPIPIDLALNKGQDITRMTAAYSEISENWVKGCPGQWLWLHRRWKKRDTRNATS